MLRIFALSVAGCLACLLLSATALASFTKPNPAGLRQQQTTEQQETAQQNTTQRTQQDGRQRQSERRAERRERTRQRREQQNDPQFLVQNAWWNDDEIKTAFVLEDAQRKSADKVLEQFLSQRAELSEREQKTQRAFLDGLASANQDEQTQRREAMLAARMALESAQATLKQEVFALFSQEQRSAIADNEPWILFSDWTKARRKSSLTRRARDRERKN